MTGNLLYYGDNLEILPKHVGNQSIDLVYLDPPFNSNRSYNVLFKTKSGREAQAQIEAFNDTWTWSQETSDQYDALVGGAAPIKVADAIEGMRRVLGDNDVLAYLVMMTPRLIELHRVLKSSGSIYLHCDPTASHYLKVMMDAIFGPTQFRNEIIWRRSGSHNSPRRFGPIHDILLFYSKTDEYFFQKVHRPYLKGHVADYFKQSDDRGRYWTNALTGSGTRAGASGDPWRNYDPTAVGRHWAVPGKILEELAIDDDLSSQEKLDALDASGFVDHPPKGSKAMPTYRQYLADSQGMPFQDIWAYQPHTRGVLEGSPEALDEDVRWIRKQGDPERLGYPTQKPLGLLDRIILSSCPEEGIVMDPFCGCGTAVHAAHKLGRKWIGIDITFLAIDLIDSRLIRSFGPDVRKKYETKGIPRDVGGAQDLFAHSHFEFERWAVSLVNGTPNQKQVGDRGSDGVIRFPQQDPKKKGRIVVSVKGGASLNPGMVRDLVGTVKTERADMGILITMEPPTPGITKAVNHSGNYKWPVNNTSFPKVQVITIPDLLNGKQPDMPPAEDPYIPAEKAYAPSNQASLNV